MSHEIRTPLNGLLGLAEALETSELNVEQKELVRTIMSSSVMVADILGDILDLATMEFGEINFLSFSYISILTGWTPDNYVIGGQTLVFLMCCAFQSSRVFRD